MLLAKALFIGVEAKIVLILDDFLSIVGFVSAEVDASKAIHSDDTGNVGRADRDGRVPSGDAGLAAACLRDGIALPASLLRALFPRGALPLGASGGVDPDLPRVARSEALAEAWL